METPQPDLIHTTGCKHPSLRLLELCRVLKELIRLRVIVSEELIMQFYTL
jgi:hypothetical protein